MIRLDLHRQLIQLALHPGQLFLCIIDLPAPAQEVAVILKRASGHGAARAEQLAVQRHQPEAVMKLPGNLHCPVNVFNNHGPSKKVADQIPEPVLTGNDIRGKPHNAPFLKDIPLLQLTAVFHCRQREEGRAAEAVLLQKRDHLLGRLLVRRHNVLDAAAQGCLNGKLILLRGLDQVSDNAQDPRDTVFLLHDAADRTPVSLIALRDGTQRIKTGRLPLVDFPHL